VRFFNGEFTTEKMGKWSLKHVETNQHVDQIVDFARETEENTYFFFFNERNGDFRQHLGFQPENRRGAKQKQEPCDTTAMTMRKTGFQRCVGVIIKTYQDHLKLLSGCLFSGSISIFHHFSW